ncbi:hypothetical protein ACL02S_12620 [Nocardia sp. 004]
MSPQTATISLRGVARISVAFHTFGGLVVLRQGKEGHNWAWVNSG